MGYMPSDQGTVYALGLLDRMRDAVIHAESIISVEARSDVVRETPHIEGEQVIGITINYVKKRDIE